MPGLAEAIAEFNIFDRTYGPEILVEAADSLEHGSAHCATSRPKGGCVRLAILMHIMVEEVAILGNQACRPRLVIIRTKDGSDFRFVLKDLNYPPNRLGRDDDIRGCEE